MCTIKWKPYRLQLYYVNKTIVFRPPGKCPGAPPMGGPPLNQRFCNFWEDVIFAIAAESIFVYEHLCMQAFTTCSHVCIRLGVSLHFVNKNANRSGGCCPSFSTSPKHGDRGLCHQSPEPIR